MLKAVRDRFQPELGFNLHDQNRRTTVGDTGVLATISLLAVAGDRGGHAHPRPGAGEARVLGRRARPRALRAGRDRPLRRGLEPAGLRRQRHRLGHAGGADRERGRPARPPAHRPHAPQLRRPPDAPSTASCGTTWPARPPTSTRAWRATRTARGPTSSSKAAACGSRGRASPTARTWPSTSSTTTRSPRRCAEPGLARRLAHPRGGRRPAPRLPRAGSTSRAACSRPRSRPRCAASAARPGSTPEALVAVGRLGVARLRWHVAPADRPEALAHAGEPRGPRAAGGRGRGRGRAGEPARDRRAARARPRRRRSSRPSTRSPAARGARAGRPAARRSSWATWPAPARRREIPLVAPDARASLVVLRPREEGALDAGRRRPRGGLPRRARARRVEVGAWPSGPTRRSRSWARTCSAPTAASRPRWAAS